MNQFNLLPDVKIQYIKARRTKRLVMVISIGASALSIFVMLLSVVTVDVVQKKSLRNLNSDISISTTKLKAVPNLNQILTVQNQLNTLTGLHNQEPVSSRLFGYITQLTPNGVTLSDFQISFLTTDTIEISGNATNLGLINQFVDTLKETTYASYATDTAGQNQEAADQAYFTTHNSYPADSQNGSKLAFSDVVLSSFGTTTSGSSYTIDMKFDPAIFANTNNIALRVPVGTVSSTSALFKKVGN
jgi:hypothetical protein